jgi:hypothetical protein
MKRYAVNQTVSLREESEGALLYNPDTDEVLIINETGRIIWGAITKPMTIEEISTHLIANTEGAVNVQTDVEAFITSLLPEFVITNDEKTATKE